MQNDGRFKKGNIPWNKGMSTVPVKVRKISNRGKFNANWKGGMVKTSDGYILVHNMVHPNRTKQDYIPEHRLIVECIIGRYLTKKEQIHHLGERDNNDPEMLMAFSSSKAHRRFERNLLISPEEIIFDGRKLKKERKDGKQESGAELIESLSSTIRNGS